MSRKKAVRLPSVKRSGATAKAYLEPEDVESLEKAATNLRDRLLIRILFRLGCRISEALGITVEDTDFTMGSITIEHLKTRLKISCGCGARLGRSHAYCPKCGRKLGEIISQEMEHRRQRVLPVDNETLALLQDYIRRGGPVLRDGKRLVFNVNRHRGWQVIKECAERAGLPCLINPETGKRRGVSPHRLRDAFAVHAMKIDDSGDGLRLLQEQLGHASFNTTAKYRKVAGEELRGWYKKLWKEKNGG